MTDPLDRDVEARNLCDLIIRARKAGGVYHQIPLSINVCGPWGSGKTRFLSLFEKELGDRYLLAKINAWQDDRAEDPLIAVIAAITTAIEAAIPNAQGRKWIVDSILKAATIVARETAVQLLTVGVGAGTAALAGSLLKQTSETGEKGIDWRKFGEETIKGSVKSFEGQVENQRKQTASVQSFKDKLSKGLRTAAKAGNYNEETFIVVVDELDRCRPLYAIHLLEDIKHLFDVPELVFVVATDTEQLAHSVNAIYGERFSSYQYLRRFFDRVFVFKNTRREPIVTAARKLQKINDVRFFKTEGGSFDAIANSWADCLHLSIRDIEQCMPLVAAFLQIFPAKVRVEPIYLLTLIFLYHNGQWSMIWNNDEFLNGNSEIPTALKSWKLGSYLGRPGDTIEAMALVRDLLNHGYERFGQIANYDPRFSDLLNSENLHPEPKGRSWLTQYPRLLVNAGQGQLLDDKDSSGVIDARGE